MKPKPIFLLTFALASTLLARDPASPRSSVPGKYPSIIHLDPVPEGTPAPGLFNSELSGRDIQFLKNASRIGADELALADLAKTKAASEQIKAVAETLGTAQATESKEIALLAASKKVALTSASASTVRQDFEKLEGPRFEKAWVERFIAVSEESVQSYEAAAKATDADIRAVGTKLLPVAGLRLQLANRLGGRSVAPPAPTPAPVQAQPKPASPAPTKAPGPSSPAPIAPPTGGKP